MMIQGIEHTAIASPDPERLAQWYVETLGFKINYQSKNSRTVFVKAENGTMIEIIEAAHPAAGAAKLDDPGIRHLALTVADFPSACERLKELGVAFLTEPTTKGGNSLVFFTDPDGNLLHLLHREKPLG
jgi:glyoxylase I family protein